ncbi:transmembrane protein 176B-like [Dunckerocampus dactyliophorus]|uniref:transmembrane protein 176B-like n=1 Tax=Dunckerocampus dactyliophorus TaxID=161453 RepID=UPI0024049B97|nr:transmembrane protein 176B-like [Dunckerocampus dactyliophorus]
MSLTMTQANEVTVLTLTSDSKSRWPPLCQIFCGLCYSPFCCSVSQHLRTAMGTSQSALGALHIMVGLLHIGLGIILLCTGPSSWWRMTDTVFPEWLGGLFIIFGIFCILSEKYPSPCLIIVNVILNISGIAFAIAAIVLYSFNLAHTHMWDLCERYDNQGYWRRNPTPTKSASEEHMKRQCLEGKDLLLTLLRAINGVLIVLSVLELCLVISSSVLAIKALTCSSNRDKKSVDPEKFTPLLEENNPSA